MPRFKGIIRSVHRVALVLCLSIGALAWTPREAAGTGLDRTDDYPQEMSQQRQHALSLVSYISDLIRDLPHRSDQVTAWVVVGETLWGDDPGRARECFRLAWETIGRVTEGGDLETGNIDERAFRAREERHRLRMDVLHHVAALDQQLERELIARLIASEETGAAPSDFLNARELVDVAANLLQDDPHEAVDLAEISLDRGLSPGLGSFLQDLRETDPESADRIFNTALRTAERDDGTHVEALLSLLDYAFPKGEGEANDSVIDSDRTGQLLETLASQLRPPDGSAIVDDEVEHPIELSSADRLSLIQQHLPLFQRYVPETVSFLQSTSEQPSIRTTALSATSGSAPAEPSAGAGGELISAVPSKADIQARDQFLMQAAIDAAQRGDVHEAETTVRRIHDPTRRLQALDLVNLEIALQAVAEGDLPRARHYAWKVTQLKHRAAIYVMTAEKLIREGDPERAGFWLQEATAFVSRVESSIEKIQTLFRLSQVATPLDPDRGFDIAQTVVLALNRVDVSTYSTPCTPTMLRSALNESVTRMFKPLGRVDAERAFYLAAQLESLDTRLLAELAICQVVLADQGNRP